MVPQGRRMLGWVTAVSLWEIEHHEVQIEFESDVVSDVKALVRRSRRTPKPADVDSGPVA